MDILAIGNFTSFGSTRALPGSKAHFMVYKGKGPTQKKGYVSICLEYAQFVWDKVEKISIKKLLHQTEDYLKKMNASPENRKALFRLIGQTDMEAYWGIYRQLVRLYGDPEEQRLTNIERRQHKIESNVREMQEDITSLKVDMVSLKRKLIAYEEGIKDESLVGS